jgi:hypothetical protein
MQVHIGRYLIALNSDRFNYSKSHIQVTSGTDKAYSGVREEVAEFGR